MFIEPISSIVTHVVCPKIIQSLGNLDLLFGIEEGIGKLFTLTQRTLNDLKSRDIAQEITNWLVWIVSGRVGVCFGLDGGEAWVGWRLQSVIVNLEQKKKKEKILIEAPTRCIGTISTIGRSIRVTIAIGSSFRFAGGAHCDRFSRSDEVSVRKKFVEEKLKIRSKWRGKRQYLYLRTSSKVEQYRLLAMTRILDGGE